MNKPFEGETPATVRIWDNANLEWVEVLRGNTPRMAEIIREGAPEGATHAHLDPRNGAYAYHSGDSQWSHTDRRWVMTPAASLEPNAIVVKIPQKDTNSSWANDRARPAHHSDFVEANADTIATWKSRTTRTELKPPMKPTPDPFTNLAEVIRKTFPSITAHPGAPEEENVIWQSVTPTKDFSGGGGLEAEGLDPDDLPEADLDNVAEHFDLAVSDPDHPYHELAWALLGAFEQAAMGKGKDRHANDLPFTKQRMQTIAQGQGHIGGHVYQICKKAMESERMGRGARVRELQGAINYAAGAIIFTEREGK